MANYKALKTHLADKMYHKGDVITYKGQRLLDNLANGNCGEEIKSVLVPIEKKKKTTKKK